jgi:hypothetical protein
VSRRGFGGGWRRAGACVTGVSCFPDSCQVRGGRPGRSRTGRSPAAVAAPEASLRWPVREPDDLAAGKREPGACRAVFVYPGPSHGRSSSAGSAAGCIHPFAWSPAGGRGRMGRVRVTGERSGGVNHVWRPRRGNGGGAEDLATSRLAAGQGGAVHAARAGGGDGGPAGGLVRQRI